MTMPHSGEGVIHLYKNGDTMGMETNIVCAEAFIEKFAGMLDEMIHRGDYEADWEFQLVRWLPQMAIIYTTITLQYNQHYRNRYDAVIDEMISVGCVNGDPCASTDPHWDAIAANRVAGEKAQCDMAEQAELGIALGTRRHSNDESSN